MAAKRKQKSGYGGRGGVKYFHKRGYYCFMDWPLPVPDISPVPTYLLTGINIVCEMCNKVSWVFFHHNQK